MRSRSEILMAGGRYHGKNGAWYSNAHAHDDAILEVLLDIRDLLTSTAPPAPAPSPEDA